MPNPAFSHHNDLPANLRSAGLYTYLDTHHLSYWRHAVDVAHQLLDRFHEKHAGEAFACYYQDQFSDDFRASLKQTDLDPTAQLLGPFELDRSLRGVEQENDPNHAAYRDAVSRLKDGPRGMAIVYKSIYGGGSHWEASVHCGGGHVSGCSTMKRTDRPATHEAILANVLSYESYLARKQAELERNILAGHVRISELGLRPGTNLKDVEITVDYKTRSMRFVIVKVHENGMLTLGEGKMRGSSKTYQTTISAARILAGNVVTDKKSAPVAVRKSEPTLALF